MAVNIKINLVCWFNAHLPKMLGTCIQNVGYIYPKSWVNLLNKFSS
jgi:hypothetical protein